MLIKTNRTFLVKKKLKKYTDNFYYSRGMIWNNTPSDVREAKSLTALNLVM